MRTAIYSVALFVLGGALVVGCQKPAATSDDHHEHGDHAASPAEIQQALAKLSPDDRKLAVEQGYCANERDSKLGSMGTPLKVMVKERAVFVCCEACSKRVLANPDDAIKAVDVLRAKTAAESKAAHP